MDLPTSGSPRDLAPLLDRYERLADLRRDAGARARGEALRRVESVARELLGALPRERLSEGDDEAEVEVFTAGFLEELLARLAGEEAAPDAVFLGHTPQVRRLRRRLPTLASTAFPLLIVGERGTGKGKLARGIHAFRGRGPDAFFAVSCSAVPPSLAESVLFGHEKGAFTGAHVQRTGLLAAAHRTGGTLYLDDVGEFAASVQPKLLEAVEEGAFFPVGGDRPTVIGKGEARRFKLCSSSQPSALRNVRPDLLDRLSTLLAILPPLRERPLDALLLADAEADALSRQQGVERRFVRSGRRVLLDFTWPGNVRQLRNVVARAFLLPGAAAELDGERVEEALAEEERLWALAGRAQEAPARSEAPWPTLREVETRHIQAAMSRSGGNVTRAARLLGLRRTTLQSRLRALQRRGDEALDAFGPGAGIPATGADGSAAPAPGTA